MIKFIAEVSSNHNRDLSRSMDFIVAAARSGCSAVKFQLFKIEQLFSPEILERSENHRKRKEWELPLEFVPKLAQRCNELGIEFSCTPFYIDAVAELEPYVAFYKVASYELLWDELLAACAQTGKPVILSTGMATIAEIKHAVKVLQDNGCKAPTLLHCTSAYPTPYAEANLAAIDTIQQATGCDVGWSDHTVEPAVIYRAVHKWNARVIEFHIDLDGKGEEFAAGHCWLPDQIGAVIRDVEKGFVADGNGIKEPVPAELPDRLWRADPSDGLRPLKEIRTQVK
ncbi:MAG: N-acetylneuraminate synthase family protein [Methylobacter sp.]|uniref:N-acetylneuraminate synthase family protein n=1 Tax=Candidatus Methylobacter titanis TaxID=3053457 RepID=A0AA43Q4Z8_9GAMM|nr:N-acetylneuraminate synthase family protein [Candidatus Methylobacter titanis]